MESAINSVKDAGLGKGQVLLFPTGWGSAGLHRAQLSLHVLTDAVILTYMVGSTISAEFDEGEY